MESFFRIDQGPTVCVHRCTCLKYTQNPNHGVGVHVVTSLVPLTIIWLCCSLLLLSTMLVYMCTCMYIGLSWTSVLSASFSSFVPHCHQLSIVGDKDSEFLK